MPESGFTLDQIINLQINFFQLALTQGTFYTELPEWMAIKENDKSKKLQWRII